MLQRVELDKDGNWADILDVADLRDGDRKLVNRAIRLEVGEDNRPVISGGMEDDMCDALLRRVVQNWTLGATPAQDPGTPDQPGALDRLTIEQGKNLREAVKPHMDAVREKNAPVKDNPVPTEG